MPGPHGVLAAAAGNHAVALLVEEVDHVGVAVAGQAGEHRALVELVPFPLQELAAAAIAGVVGVDDQMAVEVHHQRRVLVVVGQRRDPAAIADREPLAALQGPHREAEPGEVARDAAAVVIGQQDRLVAQLLERLQRQVVRMAVRDPQVLAALDVVPLRARHLVAEPPAAEVGRALQPRVGGQHRATVMGDDAGVFRSSRSRGPCRRCIGCAVGRPWARVRDSVPRHLRAAGRPGTHEGATPWRGRAGSDAEPNERDLMPGSVRVHAPGTSCRCGSSLHQIRRHCPWTPP